MTAKLHWLPKLMFLEDFGGYWEAYLEALYDVFKRDFVESSSEFKGRKLNLKRHPMISGKEATFWHIISEGTEEEERLPDMRRCERISWPRPIIDHNEDKAVKVWKNQRRGETRICLWLEKQDYLVVIAERESYLLFWTAYPVAREHTRRKLLKEYKKYTEGLSK